MAASEHADRISLFSKGTALLRAVKLGLCVRCCFRMCCYDHPVFYGRSDTYLWEVISLVSIKSKFGTLTKIPPYDNDKPCPACLGLLQVLVPKDKDIGMDLDEPLSKNTGNDETTSELADKEVSMAASSPEGSTTPSGQQPACLTDEMVYHYRHSPYQPPDHYSIALTITKEMLIRNAMAAVLVQLPFYIHEPLPSPALTSSTSTETGPPPPTDETSSPDPASPKDDYPPVMTSFDLSSPAMGTQLYTLLRRVLELKDAVQIAVRGRCGPIFGVSYESENGLCFNIDVQRAPASPSFPLPTTTSSSSKGGGIAGVTESPELDFLFKCPSFRQAKEKDPVSTAAITAALDRMTVGEFLRHNPNDFHKWKIDAFPSLAITLSHSPLLIMGRYCKWYRALAQTPWVVDGTRYHETCVQELIALPLLPFFYSGTIDFLKSTQTDEGSEKKKQKRAVDANSCTLLADLTSPTTPLTEIDTTTDDLLRSMPRGKGFHWYGPRTVADSMYLFHASGREDVDVRMLGNGRPFILEVLNPHKSRFTEMELNKMANAVICADPMERVTIHDLHIGSRGEFDHVMGEAEKKRKGYRCCVWAARDLTEGIGPTLLKKISDLVDLNLSQKTPIRVLHRRTILSRDKTIHSIRCEVVCRHWMVVDLIASSGTYIKEFITGDHGRTCPSLSSLLGCRTDITQTGRDGRFHRTLHCSSFKCANCEFILCHCRGVSKCLRVIFGTLFFLRILVL